MTDNRIAPSIPNTPGLVWRRLKSGWTAQWQARTDLVRDGYTPKSMKLWRGTEPNEVERQWISDICNRLQGEMLVWSRGVEDAKIPAATGTLAHLINCYRTDPDSTYHSARYKSRQSYAYLCKYIAKDYGDVELSKIDGRMLRLWHRTWAEGGKIPMAHGLIGMLRTLATFGKTILRDPACKEIKELLHDLRFKVAKPRKEWLTADQANLVRAKAHEMGRPSIALAQAFQFECMLRQKDVIGEWVPQSEPGLSDVTKGQEKWLRGIRWSEIDGNLILRHTTSKREKDIEFDLKLAPMVMEEFRLLNSSLGGMPMPTSGPIIVRELDRLPWVNCEFRRIWRQIARACGIPDKVRNMDSRAGAITEATDASADIEHVKHAATHSNISTTQGYSRGQAEKIRGVAQKRIAHRNKARTGSE